MGTNGVERAPRTGIFSEGGKGASEVALRVPALYTSVRGQGTVRELDGMDTLRSPETVGYFLGGRENRSASICQSRREDRRSPNVRLLAVPRRRHHDIIACSIGCPCKDRPHFIATISKMGV
jgi:hypothetical protein